MPARIKLLNDAVKGAAEMIRDKAIDYGRVEVEYRDAVLEFDAFDTEYDILNALKRVAGR